MFGTRNQSRMPLRWEQIDERVATQVNAHTVPPDRMVPNDTVQTLAPSDSSQTALTRENTEVISQVTIPEPQLGMAGSAVSLGVSLTVVFLYMSICFHLTGPAATLILASLPVGVIGLCMTPSRTTNPARHSPRPRGPLVADARLREAFTHAAATRAEALYGEIILLLAEKTNEQHSRNLRRDLLRHCNTLVANHYRIEQERQQIRRLLDASSPHAPAEAEQTTLQTQAEAQTDPIARHAWETSLLLCEERVKATSDLPTLLARLDAHDEVVCQALLLARATLTRIEAAPVALALPEIEELRQTVRRASQETRALEELEVRK